VKERKIEEKGKFLEEQKTRNELERQRIQQEKIGEKEIFSKTKFTKNTGLAAINFCEENNIVSKSKLRRLKMKFEKWSWENERDVEAMRLEYNQILDIIEKFENQ